MGKVRSVLLETLLVAFLGLVFALAANALSPRGLRLSRNYFPTGEDRLKPALLTGLTNSAPTAGNTNQGSPVDATLQRLQQHGLQTVSSNEVAELVQGASYDQGLSVLIDARDDSHYQAGHVPGAWQFDHYHAEQYLPAILPVCLNAQKVVVYCKGGACEDSEFAAIMLKEAGVPASSLFVYAGGIGEWMPSGRLVETGVRRSGQLVRPSP